MLTADERNEFTILAAIAFDLARVEAERTKTRIPCWLCTSREAKDAMLAKAAEFVGSACHCLTPPTVALAAKLCEPMREAIQPKLDAWIAAEEMMKGQRERGNPVAYFV